MQFQPRARGAAYVLAGVLALAGCSTGSPTAGPTAGAPAATTAATVAPPTAPPATEAGPMVLEDAGLETPITPGTYTSRLFAPTLTLELGEGWFRRDAGSERVQNLRRGIDGGDSLTFFSGVDFIQCGKGGVIEAPDASTIVDEIFGMQKLAATQPAEIQVGDRVGTEVRLPGTGEPLPEGEFDYLQIGCVITLGEVPYPGDSGWVTLTRDSPAQFVFVEVDDRVVLIRGSADDSTTDHDALWDLMTEVINSAQLG